jgi:hypothetical protein
LKIALAFEIALRYITVIGFIQQLPLCR